ncbi:MAG TPA: TonB-dependent receptor [Vicinamibacterales bacterium]|nr:TonB-dependent receptor [Vicinamibacterales bacterium]
MVSSALVLYLLAQAALSSRPESHLNGVVVDATGAPVPGAVIESTRSPACATRTDPDGTFSLPCAREGDDLRVSAPGFRPRQVAPAVRAGGGLRIVLEPALHAETVIVTATRTDQSATSRAAPVSVVTAAELAMTPVAPLDDVLRRVPGFSLFRRSSSRVSNPTTHGASLRGLTASGASRALVLADGVALNDPFGGWVSWTRVPQAAIERVEVVRGGASDLYGADALAGVIQVLTTRPKAPMFRGELRAATQRTGRISVFGGTLRDGWEGTVAAEAFTTEGYVLVPEPDRGAVDEPAGSRYATVRVGGGYSARKGHLRGSGLVYVEDRRNGTPLQTNDTAAVQGRVDAGGDAAGGRWRATVHGAGQIYRQAFSAIAADRASERLTLRQRVPSSERGLAAEWSRAGARFDVLAGGDVRQTEATNHEQGYFPDGRERDPATTDAFQRTSGLFLQTSVRPSDRVTLLLGVRGDLRQRERSLSIGRAEATVSPRLAAAWALTPAVVLRGAVSWSYRAPTLNERYRGFRVGSIETLPNPELGPEQLRTLEGGAFYAAGSGSLRVTLFRSGLTDAITNVTIETTPTLILRRRENVGGVRAWGAEVEGEWALHDRATITGAAALTSSRFHGDPLLEGLRVPQVPRWQIAAGLRWIAPASWTAEVQLRAFGSQFDDDRNTLELGAGAVVDVTVARPLTSALSVVAGVENLFDARYDIGRTPTRTVGPPIGVHLGIRADIGGR